MALTIKNVIHDGVAGLFKANADMIGWKGEDGTIISYQNGEVQRAEWLEGKLRILCLQEEEELVLALEGFQNSHYDQLWRHFESNCNVYIKKHRKVAALSEDAFDAAMASLEKSADQVDEAKEGSVMKKTKEQNLLKKVEGVRDGLEEAVKGDKQALSRVFAANGCERIGRLRLVLDTVELEVYKRDQRWLHIRKIAQSVESVLREVGSFHLWKPSAQDDKMARRQMIWELRKRQGGDNVGMIIDDWENNAAEDKPQAPATSASSAVSRLRQELEGLNPLGPLGGGNPLSGGYTGNLEPLPPKLGPELPPARQISEETNEETDEFTTDAEALSEAEAQSEAERLEAAEQAKKDLAKYEDEEVDNPNLAKAAPPGHETIDRSRMNYTRSDSVLEGWVWKRSRFLKKWRRRWLVLTKDALESLKAREGLRATEIIETGTVHRVYSADTEVQMARCFCVVGKTRSFYMVCDDEAGRQEWMRQVVAVLGTQRVG